MFNTITYMASEYTYKYIKPLLKEECLIGNILKCTFQAPNQKLPLEAKHVLIISENEDEFKDVEVSKTHNTKLSIAWNSLFKSQKNNTVSIYEQIPLTGNQRLLENRLSNVSHNYHLSTNIIKEAVVNAFKNIAAYYVFDGTKWIYEPHSECY